MAEASGHISEHVNVINVIYDVNSISYTATNIHPKAGILGMLLKVINVFRSENLALFIVSSINSTRKNTENRSFETRWKVEIQGSNSLKSLKEKKRKGVQYKKLIDASCESNLIVLLKNFSYQKSVLLL